MDAPSLFSDKELAFLAALVEGEVSFLVVGLAAAALQGAPAVTQDVDLWFRDLSDPRLAGALQRIGASYIPPTHLTPPLLAGAGTDRSTSSCTCTGWRPSNGGSSGDVREGRGHRVPVLPLERIIASKRATGRPKDLSILPALEDALRARAAEKRD